MLKKLVTAAIVLAVSAAAPAAAEEESEGSKMDLSKGGVVFSSGHNSLAIGARVQVRGTWDDREAFDADTAGTGLGLPDDPSGSFDVPRLRVTLKGGMFRPWLKYEFQYEFSRTGGDSASKVKDAMLELGTNPMALVKVGQFKVPFSLQELTSSGRQQFVDRAITNAKFTPARDQGVALTGTTESKHFGYAVGVFNGSGESRVQDDESFLYAGRVWFDPFGEYKLAESAVDHPEDNVLHLGLGYRGGEAVRGTATTGVFDSPDNQSAANLELAWKLRSLFATAEYFVMTDSQENPAIGPDLDSSGFHAQFGVMAIPKKLELGARYARIDPNDDANDDTLTEARLVAGWFWQGHNLKLQGDVGQVEYDSAFASLSSLARRGLPSLGTRLTAGEKLEDKQVRLQIQLAF